MAIRTPRIKSATSFQRRPFRSSIFKTKIISSYIQMAVSELLIHGKYNDARLFERLYHWYNSDIVDNRKNDFVFEAWMLTSDSIPNNNNSSSPFFSRFFQHPAFSFLSSLVFCFGLFFVAGFASEVYGQFNISGTLKSVPNNDSLFGKIVFEEIPSGTKYAKAINNDGHFQLLLPEGAYKRQIEIVNHYLFIDTVAIYSDSILNKEVIKSLPVNSQLYINANKSSLWLFKSLTSTVDNNPISRTIHRWVPTDGSLTVIPTFLRVYDPNDPISMPQGWALQYDTLINYLTINNPINDVLQLNISSFNDSLHNIQHLYVNNNSMPVPGSLGYTLRFQENNILKFSQIWMNRQFGLIDHVVQTGLREFTRSFGLESNSIDPLFVMYMSGNSNRQFHPDEVNILRTLYSLTPGTDMFPYKDSVILGVNLPPVVTVPLPNLNLLEGADETFLTKLSNHFIDPESTPLTYGVSGEFIVSVVRNDSLFVKPVEWFWGITNIVVQAFDEFGQFASDVSEITVTHVNHAPTQPTPISPINNMVLNNRDQFFFWTESSDPDGDLVSYSLRLFNESKDTTVTEISVTSFNFTDIQRLGFGQFYKWFVSSTDGEFVINSDTLIFKIKDYQQQKPDLLSPVNNDTLKSKDMNFVWTKTLGPNGEKGTYLLTIFNSDKDTSFYTDTNNVQLFTNIQSALGSEKDYSWYVLSNDGFTNISSDTSRFNTGLITDVKDEWKNRKGFSLFNNYPNPFNGTTVISYTIAKAGNVRLSIYNSLGEEIAILVNGYQSENYYEVSFNAVNIPSGIYYYRIDATASDGSESFSSVKKLVLLK